MCLVCDADVLKEQDLATAQSSVINKAYNKLKIPLDRAKYLLRLKGFQFDKEQTINDPELLTEVVLSFCNCRTEL